MKTISLKKIIGSLLGRYVSIYALLLLLCLCFLDHQRMAFRSMDYLNAEVQYLQNFVKGQAPFQARQVRAALRYYAYIVKIFDQAPFSYNNMGWCYTALGEPAPARTMFAKAYAQTKDAFGINYNLGVLAYEQQEYQRAVACFSANVDLPPLDLTRRGGQWVTITPAQEFRPVHPQHPQQMFRTAYIDNYLYLMSSYAAREDWQPLLRTALTAAGSVSEKQEVFYYLAALACLKIKAYDKGIAFFKDSLAANPGFAPARTYLAEVLLQFRLHQKDLDLSKFPDLQTEIMSFKPCAQKTLFFYIVDDGIYYKMNQFK